MSEPELKYEKISGFKQMYTMKLFIAFKMAYSSCFSLGGNLDFPEFFQKKFYNISYRPSLNNMSMVIFYRWQKQDDYGDIISSNFVICPIKTSLKCLRQCLYLQFSLRISEVWPMMQNPGLLVKSLYGKLPMLWCVSEWCAERHWQHGENNYTWLKIQINLRCRYRLA